MAGNAVVGVLRALLTLDSAEFESGLKGAERGLKTFSSNAKSLGQQATQLGQGLTAALTVPILGLGAGALKSAIDFESSFAGIRKTMDATEPEFAAMAQSFRNLSREIPVNVNELNRLGEAAGALGIPKAEVVDFARVMSLLGVTTNVTADQAAESIAKIQNVFGAAGQETENFASTLVALGNNGASTEAEILALASRIASAGNTIGLSQSQVLAFSAAIADVGMEAEAGGSAMSRVFVDMAGAVSEGGKAVEGFARVAGVSVSDFSRLFREDAASAVEKFIQGLGGVQASGGDLIGTLNELGFTELRQADLLRRLAGASENVTAHLQNSNVAWQQNSALSDEARKRFETTESQMKLLWNQIKDVGITLGNALLPALRTTISAFQSAVPVLESIVAGFTALPTPIQVAGLGMLGMAAAIGPVVYGLGQLAFAASALATAFTKKGVVVTTIIPMLTTMSGAVAAVTTRLVAMGTASMAFMVTPMGLAVTAAAALAGGLLYLKNQTEDTTAATLEFAHGFDRLPKSVDKATDALKKHEAAAQDLSRSYFSMSQGGVTLGDTLESVERRAKEAADELERNKASAKANAEAFDRIWKPAIKGVGMSMEEADRIAVQMTASIQQQQAATQQLTEAQQKLIEQYSGAGLISKAREYETVLRAIGGATKLTRDEKAEFAKTFDQVIEKYTLLGPAGLAMVNHFTMLRNEVQPTIGTVGLFTEALAGIPPAVQSAGASMATLASSSHTLTLALQQVRNGAAIDWNPLSQGASKEVPKLKAAFDKILGIAEGALGHLNDIFQRAFEGGGGVGGAIKSMATNVVATLTNMIPVVGPILSQFAGAFVAVGQKIGNFFRNLFGGGEHAKVNDMRDAFFAAAGGFEEMNRRAHEAGTTLERVLRAKTVKEFEAAVDELQKKLGDFADEQAADQERLEEAVRKYGFALEELGPKMRNQQLHEQATELIEDWRVLVDSGIDLTVVNGKMAESVNDYLRAAIKTGTEVPAAMRPILESMAEQGLLTDENGDKITDLEAAGVRFGETMTQGFDRVVNKLQELIDRLQATGQQINDIPKQVDIRVDYEVGDFPNIEIPDYKIPVEFDRSFHTGGIITAHRGTVLPNLASGEVLVKALTGEAVLNRNATSALGVDAINGANAGNFDAMFDRMLAMDSTQVTTSGGLAPTIVMPSMSGVESRLERLEASLDRWTRQQPQAIAVAVQDAMVLAPKRRSR